MFLIYNTIIIITIFIMIKEDVVVRFAPSPTGYLHIGSVRTAIVNYIFCKSMGPNSKFFLRIEDTYKTRSDENLVNIIYQNLKWLNIEYDGSPIVQSHNVERHIQVANELLDTGNAYYCFCSSEQIESYKNLCKQKYSCDCQHLTFDEIQIIKKTKCPTVRIKVNTLDNQQHITVDDLIKNKLKLILMN